ncbi:MAG: tetratricopeptide repeat protein [Candidatus Heimdallarchaeaceae archaeon]
MNNQKERVILLKTRFSGLQNNISHEFTLIRIMIYKGDYSDATKNLDSIEEKENLTKENNLELNLLRAIISFELGQYQESLKIVTKIERECNKPITDKKHFECFVLKANLLIYMGSFKDSLKLVLEAEEILGDLFDINSIEYKQQKTSLLKMKGVCFRATGQLDLAKETFIKGMELSRLIGFQFEIAEILDRYAMYLSNQSDKFDKALEYVLESLKIRKEIGNKNFIAQTLNRLGILNRYSGKVEEALEIYTEALQYATELNNKDLIAILRNNIGGIYDGFGNLNEALENYAASLKLSQETNNENMIAVGYFNIAAVYRSRGELDLALENFEKALDYLQEQGYQAPISSCLNSIGLVYYNKGELKEASEFIERSIKLSEEENRVKAIGSSLYNLIRISLDENSLDKAKEYFDRFEKIAVELNSKDLNQRLNIAEALILMTSTRFQNRAKAENLLKEVINDEVIDHRITETALLVLCELLLDELKITGSKEVLEELNVFVTKIENIARNQHSYWLLTQTYWLQSQLALIALNIPKAKSLLTQAQLIAEEKELHRLILKINKEYDLLLKQAKQWARLKDEDASFDRRMSMLQIDDLIRSMTSKREIEMLEFSQENPIYLILLSKNGKTLFTRKFHTLSTLDDALIGGFIAAINSFASEIFETTGHIERIKHQDYTLIIKVEGDFLFTYVYKGQSFTALSKLTDYVENVSSIKYIWDSLQDISKSPINLNVSFKLELERKADTIFVS